ncbi:hypothetical protein GCM10010112_30870 [Actinoplanes lobatus]|uniref:Uncharacterized protein n=1 Tax=Actinoplanes lobatus TaxID=113568 RepID=A0A7W7MGC8_9ACTN|nr:hypothetical protein [Actinoplanes lobatus]MBB4748800.1 hypothetical protein [Actinoplanes lobatus]GGN67455.1 hypothetical protein GCM10010112_30870 [Actinoplanes lobatus]GIE37291.1 hypothetical protein Alo02nite_01890 [Actinoplanes lobatus]
MTALKQGHTTRVVVPPQRHPEEPAVFRFPTPDDPAPGAARVLAIALYGTVLGICGVGVGLYAVIAVFGGAPAWYLPALAALTMLSVAPVVAAFLSIHRRFLPWVLLLAAAPPMAADVMVALAY